MVALTVVLLKRTDPAELGARSEEGEGTTFTLRIPLNPSQSSSAQNDDDFLQKVLLNDRLWEKLISSE